MSWTPTETTTDAQRERAAEPTEAGPARVVAGEILVFTQDPELRAFVRKAVYAGEFSAATATNETELAATLRRGEFAAFVVGIDRPESLDVVARVHNDYPSLPIVAVSRIAGPELVRDVLRAGAADFLFGSFSTRKLLARLSALLADRREGSAAEGGASPASVAPAVRRSAPVASSALVDTTSRTAPATAAECEVSGNESGGQKTGERSASYEIVCRNENMRRVLDIVDRIGPTESTVLVQGESGTGKELIAKRIHALSSRSEAEFVEVNCGALPESLLESQLFGHEKGSFTGAVHRQVGLFEVADGGTIFLDEIGEMSLDMQVKLLRVLQFREFRRIGGSRTVKVNVRVLAATNKDLSEEVSKKNFRADLFYRLNVITLQIPPLRDRLEEIPELVTLFCRQAAQSKGLPDKTFDQTTIDKLQKYRWSGNIRELENAVERLILLSKGDVVKPSDLDEYMGETAEVNFPNAFAPTLSLDDVKRIHIANVLRENGGNKMRSARVLKINVKTLYNLIKSLDIKLESQ